jgi:hypothetical protein
MVTETDILTLTLREHEHLIILIDDLIAAIKRLPDDVVWGETSYMEDIEILNFIRIQTLSLQNMKENTLRGYYRDTFHMIRMVFEAYFVLRLVSTCDKYPFRIKVKRGKHDPSLEHAKNRIIQEAQTHFANRLVKTYWEDNNTLVAVIHGIPVVDGQGQDTGVIVPYYYQAWHDFRPVEYHLRREGLQDRIPTLRFLTGEWAAFPRRKMKKNLSKDYGLIYRYFLTFDKILDNLCLNGVLNKKLSTRVLVHYNYLSNFTHSTSDSISMISTRRITEITPGGLSVIYNHYSSELSLLYICHLLSMHLQHAIFYLKWRAIKLKNKRTYQLLCRRVEDDFGYFWFIFNKPHQYDKYTQANRKSNYRRQIFYRPEDIRLGDVRYYDDPLYRLKQLHQSQNELTSGNSYVSPFPRNDALP